MLRKKSFIIIGIIAAVIIGGSAVFYTLLLKPIPSETELPSQTIISNQKDLKEVKAFLSKYPHAAKLVDRSGPGGLRVDYSVNNLSKLNATLQDLEKDESVARDYRYLVLTVYADHEGKPKLHEMEIQCFDGKETTIIKDNILNYIETETCLES